MDGTIAKLKEICDLAEKHHAMVMVDECHAAGFMGKTGRGTPEYHGVMGQVDIITGTLGKALGGGTGGDTTRQEPIFVHIIPTVPPPFFFHCISSTSIVGILHSIHLPRHSARIS